MIGKILLLVVLTFSILGAREVSLKKKWYALSSDEKASIIKSYLAGRKYDLGLTLAAINWQESCGGRWQVSIDHNDAGIYHINLHWYFKSLGIKDTVYNRSKYTTFIILHPKLSEKYVIAKLLNLRKMYNGNYYRVWWHYNGSKKYANNILHKVRFIRHVLRLE